MLKSPNTIVTKLRLNTEVLTCIFAYYLKFQTLFSRERNRVHARNTRERKKSQMDGLQSRIQELVDEVRIYNLTGISMNSKDFRTNSSYFHLDSTEPFVQFLTLRH